MSFRFSVILPLYGLEIVAKLVVFTHVDAWHEVPEMRWPTLQTTHWLLALSSEMPEDCWHARQSRPSLCGKSCSAKALTCRC